MNFSASEIAALRSITAALSGIDVVMIGAAALREFGRGQWRATFDLDLTVALDEDNFPGPLAHTLDLRRDERLEHRWHARGVSIDVLPAGRRLRDRGHVRWGDRVMNLAGLHLAYAHAIDRPIAADLIVRVAPPPVVAVLKMVSYCDRPAERERDLGDIVHLLDEHVGPDDDRRYADRVISAELDWDHVSPYELGVDIAHVVTAAELPVVDQFLRLVRSGDAMGTLARLLRVSSFAREEREERVLRQLDAFVRGLDSVRHDH